MSGVLSSLWASYQASLRARPLATKAAAAAAIFFTSDLATQRLTVDDEANDVRRGADDIAEGRVESKTSTGPPDYRRALSGASFGVIGTVYLHHWWNFLERFVEVRFPVGRRRLANAVAKVVIDQSISAPFYYYSYYVITNYIRPSASASGSGTGGVGGTAVVTEDRFPSPADRLAFSFGRASEMVWPTMLRHWRVWPPIHLFNFYYTPLQHRVLVQNLVLVVWSGYLSHLNHGRQELEASAAVAGGEGRRPAKLRRKKTVITGLDVVEEEEKAKSE